MKSPGTSRLVMITGVLVLGLCGPAVRAERTIAADVYFDKLHGMWLGQLIGNMAGRPTEGVYSGAEPNPAESVPWVLMAEWPADDDTDLEYLAQHIFLAHGLDPTGAELRDEWLAHVPISSVYVANRQARYLMNAGFIPPLTGSYQHNTCWHTIDAQITTESLG
ncbi:MAG TPA: ADP-ribosylglycohydrolase family protein, partial [Phycisphaerae bacterium]|nr:ADP-ribosylglycohydrolase family protein [Phycisphaerae bacterium]